MSAATKNPFHDAIRSGKEPFQLLVESVRDYAIFMLDPNGIILSWNAGAERIKQYRADEAIGQHFSIFYPAAARAVSWPAEELKRAARDGSYEEEGWRLRKDGTRFWANVIITAVRDPSGTLIGFAKVTRDLTERRAADERLRQSEMRLRLLIESIQDYAIFMLDADGRVATWNPGAERAKGYTADEIVGKHFSIFYPPEEVAGGKCERELDIATTRGRFEDEGWRVRKDGSRFWASVVINAIRDESGALMGFSKVTRDLSDRVSAERERLRLAQAENAVRLRDEFLSIASHELKTPLTSMQLQVSGLQRSLAKGVPDQERLSKMQARVAIVDREVERLGKLVNDLLDVSRAASGHLHLEVEDVSLAEVVRTVARRLQQDLEKAGCALALRLDENTVGVWDRGRLEQVVTNFLSNAMKYGGGAPIEVVVARRGERAILAVSDHGIGIDESDAKRIFDRFVRVAPASNYGGLGLGLWIVRLIVEGLGGTVGVESRPGAGATFIASLPVRQAAGEGPAIQ